MDTPQPSPASQLNNKLWHIRKSLQPLLWVLAAFLMPLNFTLAATDPEIIIAGGSSVLRDNIRQYLTIAEEKCAAPLWRLQSLLGEAQEEIELAAQAVGYYQLTFTTKLTQQNDCWQLRLELTPGEIVKISSFRLLIKDEAESDAIFNPLYENPDIKIGDPLNHGRYETLKNRITTMASTHGYYDGRFEKAEILVNTAEHTAAIDLIYTSGRRYRFGEIRITHNILSDDLLNRYLNIKSGDNYDTDKLLELKNLYNASNYFNVATASPDLQHLNNYEVPIDVVLEERKRRAYSFGVGVATDTGPRLLVGFEDRYINDSGHNIKADMSTSTIKTSALLSYNIPMARPSYEFLKIYTGYEKEDTVTSYSKNQILGASYTYYQHNHWLHTYAVNFENETSRVGDAEFDTTNLIIPSVTFSRTQTDGNPYPLLGWRALAKLSGSPKTLGSDLSFLQFEAQAKYIHALPIGRLLLRTQLGITDIDADRLPASKRFFAGGDTSVRGYGYESLSPFEKNSITEKLEPIGGNNLWVGSIEYDYLIRSKWAVAAFYDIGNAADDFHFDLKRGVGMGIRWISPIGPVRVDYAKALDNENEEALDNKKGWKWHITMGPDL